MPHRLTYEPDNVGSIITLSGTVKGEEILDLIKSLCSEKSFSQCRYQIWDFSNVVETQVSIDHLRSFATQYSFTASKNRDLKIAVIPRKNEPRTLDRIFHTMQKVWGPYESKSFRDVDAAREWVQGIRR